MKVIGAEAFEKKLAAYPELVGRTVESVLKQEARATCVALGAATMPFGLTESDRVRAHRFKVERQVRQVFLTPSAQKGIGLMIRRRSESLFRGYQRATAAGDQAQMARYMAEAGVVVEALNPAIHRAARTTAFGGVEKGYQGKDLVSQQQLEVFVRKQMEKVGLAKAGWFAAAKSLGGRIRRNIVEADGKRRTEEIFPPYIKKLARKFPGLGGSRIQPGRVEVFTNVRHAEQSILDFAYDDAIYRAQQSFRAALSKAVARIRQRGFREVD